MQLLPHARHGLNLSDSMLDMIRNSPNLALMRLQALELPIRVGVKQGIMQGVIVGTTNCVFLCSYALAFWYGSTRVRAGRYDGKCPRIKPQPKAF